MDNLEKLTQDIISCEACELREGATCPVPGLGSIGARWFVIGESPGREEDEASVPFVGASGRKLDQLFDLAGIDINDVYVTNVIKCRPPNNRDPRKGELKACIPFLMREIRIVKPEYIITLGSFPLRVFIPNATVGQHHGTIQEIEIPDGKVKLISQYHPASELHNPRLRADILDDWSHFPVEVPHDFILHKTKKLDLTGMPLAALDTEKSESGGLGQWSVAYRDGEGQLTVAPFEGKQPIEFGDCPIVFHNAKYDIRELQKNGMPTPSDYHDTMIMAYCLGLGKMAAKDSSMSKSGSDMVGGLGLKYLARRHLGMVMNTWKDMQDAEPEAIAEYNAKDSVATFLLAEKWLPEMPQFYFDIDLPLLGTIMAMEDRGIAIDPEFLEEYGKELNDQLAAIDLPLNAFATQQLQSYIYGTLEIDPWKFTDSGAPAVDSEVLETVYDKTLDQTIKEVVEYKELYKESGTYVKNYIEQMDVNNRIHPEFKQTSTSTGRLSSSNPNLQNVPDPKKGSRMRALFIAPEGKKLIRMDWERMELWGIAILAKEYEMLDALMAGADPHQETADFLGIPRHEGRNVNFLMAYRGGAWKIARDFGVSIDRARELEGGYYKKYPAIEAYHKEMSRIANEEKKVSLWTGRTRRIDAMYSSKWKVKKEGEREAINMPVQGGCAEIVKLAMNDLHYKHSAPILLQVHDELLFEIDAKDALEYGHWLKSYVPSITPWDGVELPVSVGIGDNWLEAGLNENEI